MSEKAIEMANIQTTPKSEVTRPQFRYTGEMFANEYNATIAPSDPGGGYQSSQIGNTIFMANAERFIEAHFQEPLTQYAVGWGNANPELEKNLEFVAPAVTTGKRFEYAKGTNAEFFLSETDDIRAIGASFPEIRYTSTKVTARVQNKGLTVIVDLDQVSEIQDWEQQYVGRLMKRLNLNDFRRAIALLKASATGAYATTPTWDNSSGKDPDMDLLKALILGNNAVGIPLNRVMFGVTAWQKRLLSLRAQTHAGGFSGAIMNRQELADMLGLDGVAVSREMYVTTGTTKGTVVDTTIGTTGIVLAYIAYAGATTEDPSSIKRFISNCIGGTQYRVYRQELSSKLVAITVEHYSLLAVPSTLGVTMLTVS